MTDQLKAMLRDGEPMLVFGDAEPVPANEPNMEEARRRKPNLVPTPLGTAPSFGFGDRIGLATPGHAESLRRAGGGIRPIFPQQSIREMTRTDRTPRQVMNDAQFGMLHAGWDEPTGADADHLKTAHDVNRTMAVGFTFFTIDPSDDVDEKADGYNEAALRARFEEVRADIAWYEKYLGQSIELDTGTKFVIDEEACMRCAVKYGIAINRAAALARHIETMHEQQDRDYEVELSVDETEQPTTLAEHWIIASECLNAGMKLVSLAPRYIGDFEKGVDYKGDLDALEQSMRAHAAIARQLGPYKLSLHSGSDKLSMYPALARATNGMFHVKTAGTSYLEALRVVAIHEEELFRRIIDFARERYPADKATYHVSATVDSVPAPDRIADSQELVQRYLERWEDVAEGRGFTEPGRQILHCTFGSVLTHEEFGPAVRQVLESHLDTYTKVLATHFARHLQALNQGL